MQHQELFESLFKRSPEDPASKQFLEEITAAHPYFSPAQFFLLQQTSPNTAAFDSQAVKTNIFFNNPLWLQLQLRPPGEKQFAPPVHEPMATEIISEPFAEKEEPVKTEPGPDNIPEPEATITEPVNEEIVVEEPAPVADPATEQPEEIIIAHSEEPPVQETIAEPGKMESVVEETAPETTIASGVQEMEGGMGNEVQSELQPMKIELKKPELTGDALLFEPMHMVDYFASQGIKLSEEVQSADKLGKQLKSFTEWLKTMKKVHAAAPETGSVPDQTVEALAELSNRENEVITEAMADVFARQGKTAKAIEVYQKLSLLNPAKSAYFAARIENIKGA